MKASPNNILWGLVALYAATIVTSLVAPNALPIAVPVLLLLAFVLLHGALRYRLSGILLFIVIALVVSNILENTSILTGFPSYFRRFLLLYAILPVCAKAHQPWLVKQLHTAQPLGLMKPSTLLAYGPVGGNLMYRFSCHPALELCPWAAWIERVRASPRLKPWGR